MTFKHGKFEDSSTMRSFVKVANDKGWVKPETIVKQASSEDSLMPTSSLTENMMKLAASLRKAGMVKSADEVEKKFISYKAAQYNTSKETGEDLIDAAHPDKSHQLEDVDGDAIIETIIDQQLKDIKIVLKTPTGKITSSTDVLSAVKLALAQSLSDVPEVATSMTEEQLDPWRRKGAMMQLNLISSILQKAYLIIHGKMNTTTLAGAFDKNYKEIGTAVDSMDQSNISVDKIDQILSDLGDIENSVKFFNWKDLGLLNPLTAPFSAARHVGDLTDMATGNWDQDLRNQITELVNKAKLAATTARDNLRGNNDAAIKRALIKMKENTAAEQKAVEVKQAPVSNAGSKIKAAQKELYNILALVSADTTADADDVKEVNAWIAKQNAALKNLEVQAPNLDADVIDRALAKITKDVATVKQQWA